MATQIALACNRIEAYDNAIFFIHNVSGFAVGDYRELRSYADVLKRSTKNLANLYVKQTGKSYDEIKKLMNDETYFFGKEILDNGFCDFIIEIEKDDTKTKDDAVHAAELASANAATKSERISNGEKLFMANCAACHQATGKGLPGAFPPLAGHRARRTLVHPTDDA